MSDSNYTKGFIIGALIGGAAGAITALLLAPKSGAELRKEIADSSNEYYGKASEYFKNMETKVGDAVATSVSEGKIKAQNMIDSARRYTEDLMEGTGNAFKDAKSKVVSAKDQVQDSIGNIREAAKAGADAFKSGMQSGREVDEA